MASSAVLAIRIISDATKAAKGFQQTESAADRMGRRLGNASRIAKVGLLAMGAAAISAAKDAAADAASQSKLAFALRKNAGASKQAIAGTEQWISSISRATGVADDQLRPALATLVRSTGDVRQSQAALKTAMDISAATGKPLQTVSAALAKGYGGQTAAIGKLVPGLDQAALKSGDMTQIMAALNAKVGGEAANAAQTASGKYAIMVNNFNEAKEQLGAGLLPVLSRSAVVLADAAAWAQKHSTTVKVLAISVGVLAGAVVGVNTAYKVYRSGVLAARAAQVVFNLAMRANPIGLVITAIALLIAGLVLAYKKSETFRNIVNKVRDAGVAAFKQIWSWIQKAIDLVERLIGWISKIKFPSVPKAISSLGGGAGGAPSGGGGGGGFAYSGLPGEGGPSDGWFLAPMGGGNSTIVNITIDGAIDPVETARRIRQILTAQGVRFGTASA